MTLVRGERGFTLVELMVAIAVLGIIAVTVAMLLGFTLGTTEQTTARFSDSRGPKFLSAYWVPDVTSSLRVNLNSGPCGGVAPVVTFSWTDDRPAYGDVTASWFVIDTGTAHQLVRRECLNGNLSTPNRSTVIASDVNGLTDVPAGATVSCDGGACFEDQTPGSVRIDVTTSKGFTYTLDATRQLRSTS